MYSCMDTNKSISHFTIIVTKIYEGHEDISKSVSGQIRQTILCILYGITAL